MSAPVAGRQAVTTLRARGAGAGERVWRSAHLALIPLPLVAAATFVLLVLRRPETLLRAELWAEDGTFYTTALQFGPASLIQPYDLSGYIALGQRLMVLVASWASPYWMPVLANTLALATAVLVAALLASGRMPLDRTRRLLLAFGFVLLPASFEILGTLSHVQWVIAAGMIAYAFASAGPRAELVLLAVAAVTGPYSILLLPLYIGRWWFDRWTWPRVAVIGAGALIEIAVTTMVTRRPAVPPDFALFPQVIVERVTHLPLALGLAFLVLVILATWGVSGRVRLALFGVALAVPVLGLLSAGDPTVEHLGSVAPRYYWLSTGLVAATVVVARHSLARTLALAVLAGVLLTELRIAPVPATGWATNSACIGGLVACSVPVEPQAGYDGRFSVRWEP